MGRSSETFSKKEKEKKRAKKQQEKRERAEDRKANSDKGKSFEEMFAYVDHNGNITDTPPDPTQRRAVSTDSIMISTPTKAEIDPADLIRTGTVTFFNDSKGYGFIKDMQTQENFFVHVNGLTEQVGERDRVTFEIEKGAKGMNAVRVKKVAK
ncbi:cold shock domain-containing protein [Mucilaginibacter daejeonensis]|uniref:cold-shock protein n=1 Tax=Mucilaginibacter daejeonensis TaxID=398049 RepID=UPI001D179006|nr:cold shock domain-containing protein [Mucilaginibacter daejeonensis]UEG51804.1 cold shock domain-containing protein [Mucilaginibacter daejeonensis]